MPPPLLFLTRPRAQAEALAARLAASGASFEPRFAPSSEIRPLEWDETLAEGIAGVILTSANAVPFAAPLAPLPAFCVGRATAGVAEAAGFRTHAAAGDAVALLADLRRLRPEGPLLHLHGQHLARDLAEALAPEGLTIRAAAAYAAVEIDWPEGATEGLAGRKVIAPLYSPRAAAIFGKRWPAALPVTPLAISPAAARALPPGLAGAAQIAPSPEAMTACLKALLPSLP